MKVAILGYRNTLFFKKYLLAAAEKSGNALQIIDSPIDNDIAHVFDSHSRLYSQNPEHILILTSVEKLRWQFYQTNVSERLNFSNNCIAEWQQMVESISNNSGATITVSNLPEINDGIFGNHALKVRQSFYNQVKRINIMLMDMAERNNRLHILDIAGLVTQLGSSSSFDPSLDLTVDQPFKLEFEALCASAFLSHLDAFRGKIKKCLVLDLDNTLWGGVVGDDGISGISIGGSGIGRAFAEFQLWLLQLKQRGILLAVCSKNEFSAAQSVFTHRKEMILKFTDFNLFVANWNDKAQNIRLIGKELGINLNELVFIDDEPTEREFIREALPPVSVPELPADPAAYVGFLSKLNLFETVGVTDEDKYRSERYSEAGQRDSEKSRHESYDSFLQSLNMRCSIKRMDETEVIRVAQLSQRSNQFNLRTVRYTESALMGILRDDAYLILTASLSDRFGSYGLVGFVILNLSNKNSAFIDSWVMSCRAAGRGLEKIVMNRIAEELCQLGILKINGEYIPTDRNIPVADHFQKLGFSAHASGWMLDLTDYKPLSSFIIS